MNIEQSLLYCLGWAVLTAGGMLFMLTVWGAFSRIDFTNTNGPRVALVMKMIMAGALCLLAAEGLS